MREAGGQLRGDRVGRTPPPSRTYEARRICSAAGCGTRLSIYNPDTVCGRHTRAVDAPAVPAPRRERKAA